MKISYLGRLIILSAFVFSLGATPVAAYADVNETEAIKYFERLNLYEGVNFLPEEKVTKAEFFKALLRADGFDPSFSTKYDVFYSDVEPELEPYFAKMYELGVIDNDNGLMYPDSFLSKWRAMQYFFKYHGIPVQRSLSDPTYLEMQAIDIYGYHSFAPYMDRALRMGILDVENKRIGTFDKITREDVAKIMYNFEMYEAGLDGITQTIFIDSGEGRSGIENEDEFRILEDAWIRLNNDYLYADEIEKSQLIYGAIDGMVESLDDPYTTYQLPNEKTIQDNLAREFDGIGASLTVMENGDIVIISPLKDSPAERGGLLPGDIIIGVNDVSVRGKSLSEVTSLIKGPAKTEVIINVLRDGKERSFAIVRDKIVAEFVTGEMTYDNILILDVRSFGAGTANEMKKIISSIETNSVKGVILDVRNNPGGFLDQAVDVADIFLPADTAVVSVDYNNKGDEVLKTSQSASLGGLPIVVLMNAGSASASEIVAGTLQVNANAKLVGETSFGKGTVQQLINYKDESSLKLTTGEWFIPTDLGGKSINGIGLKPDVEVLISEADRSAGIDSQLNRAIQILR